MARVIHSRYIARDGPYEVHLPLSMRSAISSQLNLLHPDTVADAISFVLDVIREDSGKRFVRSEAGGRRREKGRVKTTLKPPPSLPRLLLPPHSVLSEPLGYLGDRRPRRPDLRPLLLRMIQRERARRPLRKHLRIA